MSDSIETTVAAQCREAKQASRTLAQATTAEKNAALRAAAACLRDGGDRLLAANARDLGRAGERPRRRSAIA